MASAWPALGAYSGRASGIRDPGPPEKNKRPDTGRERSTREPRHGKTGAARVRRESTGERSIRRTLIAWPISAPMCSSRTRRRDTTRTALNCSTRWPRSWARRLSFMATITIDSTALTVGLCRASGPTGSGCVVSLRLTKRETPKSSPQVSSMSSAVFGSATWMCSGKTQTVEMLNEPAGQTRQGTAVAFAGCRASCGH